MARLESAFMDHAMIIIFKLLMETGFYENNRFRLVNVNHVRARHFEPSTSSQENRKVNSFFYFFFAC